MELPRFKPGDRVNYDHRDGRRENGIVKRCESQICTYVVFGCEGDWDNYQDYTAEPCEDWLISHGWIEEKENRKSIRNEKEIRDRYTQVNEMLLESKKSWHSFFTSYEYDKEHKGRHHSDTKHYKKMSDILDRIVQRHKEEMRTLEWVLNIGQE